jgi:heat-inducible transcriptional repressor
VSVRPVATGSGGSTALTERQRLVLRAVVTAYVADAAPTSSATVSHLLPVALSSASIRNTMAELERLGLIHKPHASAGRVPTEAGLRIFVDQLLETPSLADYDRRALEEAVADVAGDGVMTRISQLLSERTRQLGFALAPRLERMTLQHVSLVRVAEDRLLVVLVPKAGPIQQRVVVDEGRGDQSELDRMAAALNERVVGRTLPEVRALVERELRALESEARSWLFRSLSLGRRIFADDAAPRDAELVITTRSALLTQPEFHDPERIRGVLGALETNERLVELLSRLLEAEAGAVSISLGEELEDPALRSCALVAVPYASGAEGSRGGGGWTGGGAGADRSDGRRSRGGHSGADADEYAEALPPGGAVGLVGVIGPSRMDYARVIPLVRYCSSLVGRKLGA